MSLLALNRLNKELGDWKRFPLPDFEAGPWEHPDGFTELMIWDCVIPGKEGTIWQHKRYKLRMQFLHDYPKTPPVCRFIPPIEHPNCVWETGEIVSRKLIKGVDWKPGKYNIKNVLLFIRELMAKPNMEDAKFLADAETKCALQSSNECALIPKPLEESVEAVGVVNEAAIDVDDGDEGALAFCDVIDLVEDHQEIAH